MRANVGRMDDNEIIEFHTGRDSYGLARWTPGLIIGREQRANGEWLRVLPKNSASDEDARWVSRDDVRFPASHA